MPAPPSGQWPPPSGQWAPAPPSGVLKAGQVVLLVGAILQAAGAAFLVFAGIALFAIGQNFLGDGEAAVPLAVVAGIYVVAGLLLAVGTGFAFSAWSAAGRGEARRAWVRGLVASLLPPLQLVTLVGAILCMVSPEGEAQAQGRAPSQAP